MNSFVDHAEVEKDIPEEIKRHLRGLIDHSGLPAGEETLRRLVEAWLLKKAEFQKIAEHGGFSQAQLLRKDDAGGCLALTLSGSLIMIGPLMGGRREIKYTSLGLRTDVPETLHIKDGLLARDVAIGHPIVLESGRLQKTSSVTDIAAAAPAENAEPSAEALRRADEKLKRVFLRHNREALTKEETREGLPDRNDLFQKWIIIQWFIYGGLEKHVFLARCRILWLELFTNVYDVLGVKKKDPAQRDELFLDFTNRLFAKFCDDYKWYESEHKNFDLGLMKALEELPDYGAYQDFVNDYCSKL